MNSDQLRNQFITFLEEHFPNIKIEPKVIKSEDIRKNVYVPSNRRNKRWIQLDANPNHLAVAMDYSESDFTEEDLKKTTLPYGLDRKRTAIKLTNNNAVNISFFLDDPYNFYNEVFISFINKHYSSYLKRVDINNKANL